MFWFKNDKVETSSPVPTVKFSIDFSKITNPLDFWLFSNGLYINYSISPVKHCEYENPIADYEISLSEFSDLPLKIQDAFHRNNVSPDAGLNDVL